MLPVVEVVLTHQELELEGTFLCQLLVEGLPCIVDCRDQGVELVVCGLVVENPTGGDGLPFVLADAAETIPRHTVN